MESLRFFFLLLGKLSKIVWLILEIVDIHFHFTDAISLDTTRPLYTPLIFKTLCRFNESSDQSHTPLSHFAVMFLMFRQGAVNRVQFITFSSGIFIVSIFFQCAVLKRREKKGGGEGGGKKKKKKKNDTLCNDKAATRRDYLRDEQVTETYTRGARRVLC